MEPGRLASSSNPIAAYLTGHLDGLGGSFDDAPSARALLEKGVYGDLVKRIHEELRKVWAGRGQWTSWSAFAGIKEIAYETLRRGGLHLHRLPGGQIYVAIP